MTDGERGLPIENYGKKEEWLDNTVTVSDPQEQGGRAQFLNQLEK